MQKAIIFTAYNGMEIIDPRPEAEIAYSNMKYAEQLYTKRNKRKIKPHKSFAEILSVLLQKGDRMKGYNTPEGYMGLVKGKYQLFASETEYYEYMLENKEV